MIIKILFQDTELNQCIYERVHQAPDGCALAAAAIASDDVDVIGELIHLISPLLEGSVKSRGPREADWVGWDTERLQPHFDSPTVHRDRRRGRTPIGGTLSELVGSDLLQSQTNRVRVRKSW